MSEPLKQVLVRMPRPMHEAIKDEARRSDRTMSQIVREAVRNFLAAK